MLIILWEMLIRIFETKMIIHVSSDLTLPLLKCRCCCLCLWEWRYHHGRPRLSQWQVKVDHHQWAPQHWQWHLRDDWILLSSPCHDHQMMMEVWPEWVVCVSPKHFYLQILTNQKSVFNTLTNHSWVCTCCADVEHSALTLLVNTDQLLEPEHQHVGPDPPCS